MANKKINQLDFRTGVALTDLLLIGDPTSGTSYKLTGTDFKTLLGFVPYTGATSNVNLGEFGLATGQVTLDTSPTGTAVVGTTRWNDTIGSSETTLKGGSVVLKNGVDLVARVVNKVTPNATLTKAAYQAVRVSGAQGQRLAVAYAQANNDANSADTIGLVCETIPTNQEGFIMTMGQLENINTTGSLQGETWADGDVLYLSPTTPGAITKVKPTGAGHIVVIGYVEYAHVNNGKIYVKVMNGWELDELHDVSIVSPANNEALIYESSTALWKNKTIATALGYTPISGSGVTGQVAYWNGTNSQTGSNNLFWDAYNSRLGIGTNAPAYRFHNVGSAAFDNGNSGDAVNILNSGFLRWTSVRFRGFASSFDFQDNAFSTKVSLSMSGSSSIFNTGGNYLFGGTLDGGQRLQVNGTSFFNGNSVVQGAFTLRADENNIMQFSSGVAAAKQILLTYNGGITYGLDIQTNLSTQTGVGNGYGVRIRNAFTATYTTGTYSELSIGSNYFPTSGTGLYSFLTLAASINQQGGANGITRGLYVNPILTAAADWRSIEWSNNSGWGLYGAGTANNYLGGRLGIGNTNPTNILDILTNANNAQYLSIKNSSTGVDASAGYIATNNNNINGGFLVYSSTFANSLFANNLGIGHNKSIVISTDTNVASGGTSKISFVNGGYSVTPQMTLTSAGRLLLGTTTESTFLLDVNGTARVQLPSVGASSYFVLSSASATAINSYFGVTGSDFTFSKGEYSWGSNLRFNGTTFVRDNTGVGSWMISQSCGNDVANHFFRIRNINPNVGTINSSAFVIGGSGNVGINREPVSGVGVSVSGSIGVDGLIIDQSVNRYVLGLASGSLRLTLNDAAQPVFQIANSSSTAIVFNSTNSYASAQLAIDSTTRGFLPPRLTTTQKNAIASPTAGLMVYDTTLNKLCVYTTAWETITSI